MSERVYDERDYIDRTIQTVRNHRDADNCWPQWANQFADEIERLRAVNAASERVRRQLAEALRRGLEWPVPGGTVETYSVPKWLSADLRAALAASAALDQEKT